MPTQDEKTRSAPPEGGVFAVGGIAAGIESGRVPIKVVTGTQHTSNLNFELKPGAVTAHAGAAVIFVCG